MSERNKALSKRFRLTCDEGRIGPAVEEFVAPEMKMHGAAPQPMGRAEMQGMLEQFYGAFPDLHHVFHDQLADGERVASRFTVEGTHRGPFNGIPATGKKVAVNCLCIDRFQDGRIVEHWTSVDLLGMLQQLGAIPSPG
jgi:steroid delta-isomerase-like uncharacterized protein